MKLNKEQIKKIDQKISIGDYKKIVRLDIYEDEGWLHDECNFNIYCIDHGYNIVWQVKELKTKPVSISGETDTFCYVGQNDKGEIIADRFSGFVYKINPDTGEAIQIGFHK